MEHIGNDTVQAPTRRVLRVLPFFKRMDLSQPSATHTHPSRRFVATPSNDGRVSVRKGAFLGLVSGLVAISCCVSPVVLVLLGVATAAEAVSLGNTLYYTYGWLFRGVGILVAGVAVVIYLRQRGSCNLRGVHHYRGMLLTLVLAGGTTYAGMFWLTRYLGIWFG